MNRVRSGMLGIAVVIALMVVPTMVSAHPASASYQYCKHADVSMKFGTGITATARTIFDYCYTGHSSWLASGVQCTLEVTFNRLRQITWCGQYGQNFRVLGMWCTFTPWPKCVTTWFSGYVRVDVHNDGTTRVYGDYHP